MVLVVVAAKEVLCGKGGHAAVDGVAVGGVARGFHPVVVGKFHLADPLRAVGGELRRVAAEGLSPDLIVSACLQLIGHVAVLELVLGYLFALRCAAGVEVVAVFDGGVVGEGVAAGGVVRADVEAVGQGAGAILVIYKPTHSFLAFVRHGSDVAFDEAVSDGDIGTAAAYIRNHAHRIASAAGMTARDVHIAGAVGNVDGAISVTNQS